MTHITRDITLKTRNGHSCHRSQKMMTVPVKGCEKNQKTEQDIIVTFDLNLALDVGTPNNLMGALGEYAGKIQQSCNGNLISCSYELHATADMDGTIC